MSVKGDYSGHRGTLGGDSARSEGSSVSGIAPGKVTRTSQLSVVSSAVMQRKEASPSRMPLATSPSNNHVHVDVDAALGVLAQDPDTAEEMSARDDQEELDRSLPPEILAAQALKLGMGGKPVELPYRDRIEMVLCRPLGNVRCFTGAAARKACMAVGARAFVVADVMVLAEPSPSFEVVLHEAVHLVQQAGHTVSADAPATVPMGAGGDAGEREAHAIADGVTIDALTGGRSNAPDVTSSSPRLSGFFYLSGCTPSHSVTFGQKGVSNASDGWLRVRIAGGENSLPWYLKVDHTARTSDRDEFKVLEGHYRGQKGSVTAKSANESHLVSGLSYKGAATVTFRKGDRKLVFGGTEIDAFTDDTNPLATGTHEIQIPDAPHSGGTSYGAFGTTWFRLGTSGDRYLHPGRYSAGCATVSDTSAWPALYSYLINSRQSNTTVGTLEALD